MDKFTVTYSPAYESEIAGHDKNGEECALYTWGQPGSLKERHKKIDHQKCHRTTYPHIL